MPQHFASDNNAGMCPQALDALIRANAEGHVPGYGDDPWTDEGVRRACASCSRRDCEVFFVFNGTAANALALAADLPVLPCGDRPCVQPHRGGRGRRARAVLRRRQDRDCRHAAGEADAGGGRRAWRRSAAACITSSRARCRSRRRPSSAPSTPSSEIAALADVARRHGLKVHMDGARFANAVASLGCAPADLSWRAGVDVLCFGGVKNGLAVGEAVLFFDRELARRVRVARQAGRPAQLQDAPRHGAVAGAARERRVARERAPRQRHGAAARTSASPTSRACA